MIFDPGFNTVFKRQFSGSVLLLNRRTRYMEKLILKESPYVPAFRGCFPLDWFLACFGQMSSHTVFRMDNAVFRGWPVNFRNFIGLEISQFCYDCFTLYNHQYAIDQKSIANYCPWMAGTTFERENVLVNILAGVPATKRKRGSIGVQSINARFRNDYPDWSTYRLEV